MKCKLASLIFFMFLVSSCQNSSIVDTSPNMKTKQELSLDELKEINKTIDRQSPEELRGTLEKLLASLPKEAQENFRKMQAEAALRPPRPRLTEITSASLKALEREDLDLAVYEYVATRIYDTNNPRTALLMMPRGLQVFYLTFLVEAEVMNGGFNQFFWNPSSEMGDLIAPALRELHADEAAVIFEQALRVSNLEHQTRTKHKEDRSLDAFSKSYEETNLNKFDSGFAALAEKFPALRVKFIRTNEQQFLSATR
jgi:hypothetical protein